MATFPPTERWADRTYSQTAASRSFDAPGYPTGPAAIAAVINNFGTRAGNSHPDDPYLFVNESAISTKNNQGPTMWIVTVPYLYLSQAALGSGNSNPLTNPTRWLITTGLESVNVDCDAYGNPIVNSAGTPFEPKATRTINTLQITATRHYANFSIGQTLQYMNKINAAPIQVKSLGLVPTGCMKCVSIAPTAEIVLSMPAPVEVQIRFEVRGKVVSNDANDPAFRIRILDAGYSGWYAGTSGNYQEDFSSPDPENVGKYKVKSTPTLLDGRGKPRDAITKLGISGKTPIDAPLGYGLGDEVKKTSKKPAVFLYYDVEDSVDFGPLLAGL